MRIHARGASGSARRGNLAAVVLQNADQLLNARMGLLRAVSHDKIEHILRRGDAVIVLEDVRRPAGQLMVQRLLPELPNLLVLRGILLPQQLDRVRSVPVLRPAHCRRDRIIKLLLGIYSLICRSLGRIRSAVRTARFRVRRVSAVLLRKPLQPHRVPFPMYVRHSHLLPFSNHTIVHISDTPPPHRPRRARKMRHSPSPVRTVSRM